MMMTATAAAAATTAIIHHTTTTILSDLFIARLILGDDDDFEPIHRLSQCSRAMADIARPRLAPIREHLHLCLALKDDLYDCLVARVAAAGRKLTPLFVAREEDDDDTATNHWTRRAFVLPDHADTSYDNGDVEIDIGYRDVKACAKHLFVVNLHVTGMRDPHLTTKLNNMTLQVQPYTKNTGLFKLITGGHPNITQCWLGYRDGIANSIFPPETVQAAITTPAA